MAAVLCAGEKGSQARAAKPPAIMIHLPLHVVRSGQYDHGYHHQEAKKAEHAARPSPEIRRGAQRQRGGRG